MSEKKEIEITIRIRVDKDMSLEELERLIDQTGDAAKREALKKALREKESEQPLECTVCDRRGPLYGKGSGVLVFQAFFGRIRMPQPRYRCPDCGAERYPLAEALELIAPGPVSPGVYRLAVLEGISRSYEESARHLAEMSRGQIQLSAKQIHGLVQRAGATHLSRREQEIALLWTDPDCARPISRGQTGDLFCVESDGGWVPERGSKGNIEGKVVKMWWDSKRKQRGNRPVITEKVYLATFDGADPLGREACAVSMTMGVDENTPTLFLADGDAALRETIWQVYFPWAQYRLDWRHLRNYVWRAVKTMWQDLARQQEHGRRWVQWLWDGYIDEVLAEAQGASMRRPEAKKARDNLVKYIEDNRAGMGCYHLWHLQSETISTGVIEKAVDEVIVRRQKKQGMNWSRAGANVVAALRALWLSGQRFWEQFWRGQPILVQSNVCLHGG